MRFVLDDFHRDVPEEELLADLLQAQRALVQRNQSLSYRSYKTVGKYSAATIAARFGSWNAALIAAGIARNEVKNATDEELFQNLKKVWVELGRQPKTRDLAKPLSQFSHDVYRRRFGGYRQALNAFMEYIQAPALEDLDAAYNEKAPLSGSDSKRVKPKRRTSRTISDRLRFRVLMRDGFACQSCGASPQNKRGVELHVDHIVPWSRGGETVEENLQTKCKRCNLGKSNAFMQ